MPYLYREEDSAGAVVKGVWENRACGRFNDSEKKFWKGKSGQKKREPKVLKEKREGFRKMGGVKDVVRSP